MPDHDLPPVLLPGILQHQHRLIKFTREGRSVDGNSLLGLAEAHQSFGRPDDPDILIAYHSKRSGAPGAPCVLLCRSPDQERWKGLKTIGLAMLTSVRDGKKTCETRYFLSSLPVGVKLFACAVRSQWSIENSCHWSLDFTYREDALRIRDKFMRENFAWLNRFTLSLLKQHPTKMSQVMKRRRCGWSDSLLCEVLLGKATELPLAHGALRPMTIFTIAVSRPIEI